MSDDEPPASLSAAGAEGDLRDAPPTTAQNVLAALATLVVGVGSLLLVAVSPLGAMASDACGSRTSPVICTSGGQLLIVLSLAAIGIAGLVSLVKAWSRRVEGRRRVLQPVITGLAQSVAVGVVLSLFSVGL